MTIIKRDRKTTTADLVSAIDKLIVLLAEQKEDDAIKFLIEAANELKDAVPSSQEHRKAVDKVIEAFEGDHELIAYTHQREGTQWTEVEELSQASSRVISLARRMR